MNTIKELLKDCSDTSLPKDIKAYDKVKCELKAGMKVGWYFKDDEKFWLENSLNPRRDTQYSGIVVPAPDIELRGDVFEPEDCVIVMTSYPVEKEYPESTWFAFRRLLDNPELVEVFNESTLEIEQTEAATGLSGMYAKLELQRDTVQKRFEAETLITSRLYKQLQQFKTALNDMMVGQEFDGGGHVIKRIAPPHSAVIKSKMLLGVAASKK